MDVARGVSRRRQLRGSLHAASACRFLTAFLLLALPLSFSTPSLSLHSFPFCPRYLSPFFMFSLSLSLGFPLCFSSLLISLRSYSALGYTPLPPPTVVSPPSTRFAFSPGRSLSPPLQLGTVLLCQHQLPCFSCGAVNVPAVLWRWPNKRIFSFQLRDGEGLHCWPERSAFRWLSRLHPATSPA